MTPQEYGTEAIMIMFASTDKKGEIEKLIKKVKDDESLTDTEKELALQKIKFEVGDIARIAIQTIFNK